MLNFWCNIATGDDSKISTILYKWTKDLYDKNIHKSLWLDKIKTTLDEIGMTNLFNDITNVNKNWFKNAVKLRLKDIYDQKWAETVFNNSICLSYRVMTTQNRLKSYLLKLPSQYMYALCKFKCVNHKMPIVIGRYAKIPVDERKCTLCELDEIGDEFHYLFKCPFFNDHRVKLIKKYYVHPNMIKKYYYVHPNMIKMEKLFHELNNRDMLNLGKYIYLVIQRFRNS